MKFKMPQVCKTEQIHKIVTVENTKSNADSGCTGALPRDVNTTLLPESLHVGISLRKKSWVGLPCPEHPSYCLSFASWVLLHLGVIITKDTIIITARQIHILRFYSLQIISFPSILQNGGLMSTVPLVRIPQACSYWAVVVGGSVR